MATDEFISAPLTMHIPDGFVDVKTAVTAAALAATGLGLALAQAKRELPPRRVPLLALAGLLAGTLLFAGSLAFAALLGWPTRLAPLGGTVLMASWLLYAVGVARR